MSIQGIQTYIGLFETEQAAALAVNQKCLELGIPERNPSVSIETNFEESNVSTSARYTIYTAVHWFPNRNQWGAQFVHQNKSVNIGYFQTDEEAAIAVNEKCIGLGIPLKNPGLANNTYNQNLNAENKVDDNEMRSQNAGLQDSNYNYVYYDNQTEKKPVATLNTSIKKKTVTSKKEKSLFSCVHWDSDTSKWVGEFRYFSKTINCGYWENEKEAAYAVNAKCNSQNLSI